MCRPRSRRGQRRVSSHRPSALRRRAPDPARSRRWRERFGARRYGQRISVPCRRQPPDEFHHMIARAPARAITPELRQTLFRAHAPWGRRARAKVNSPYIGGCESAPSRSAIPHQQQRMDLGCPSSPRRLGPSSAFCSTASAGWRARRAPCNRHSAPIRAYRQKFHQERGG
jgi:hypothetical protein